MSKLIYIADDEIVSRHMIRSFLEMEGFTVRCFENGDLLYETFINKKCDLIVLDAIMPGNDGFIIGKKIRQISDLPIIMLTGQTSDENYVLGISIGFDAYLTKPINRAKLIAHVRVLLAKSEAGYSAEPTFMIDAPDIMSCADVTVSISKYSVHCNQEEMKLTKNEFKLLAFMLRHQDRVVTRDELLTEIWGYEADIGTRAIDDAVKRLRKKLADANSRLRIKSVWGVGFKVGVKD